MTLVEVDLDVAEKFFEADGVIHVHSMSYGMHAGYTIEKRNGWKSVKHGMDVFRGEDLGEPVICVDPDDPHPKCPVRRDSTDPNKHFAVTTT